MCVGKLREEAEEKYNFTILTPHLSDLILVVPTMRVMLI